MFELFQLWLLVELVGLCCLPLTTTVFRNLPDRGWAFSKTLGLVVLAFVIWLPLMTLHFLPFSQLFVIGVALLLLVLNVPGFVRMRHTLVKLVRVNWGYVVATEVLFLGMMFLLGWIRSFNPDIRSYEMFMDMGFLASIMRSEHFPPHDMWFSGYAINYYYYAHFVVAALAKMLHQAPEIAFNTGFALLFGLTASNIFGVTSNVVAWAKQLRRQPMVEQAEEVHVDADTHTEPVAMPVVPAVNPAEVTPRLVSSIPFGLLAVLMALVMGNLASATELWVSISNGIAYDWFKPSRIIGYTINEFPAFSFLLNDFHAHVLALPFTILAIGLIFNLFLESEGKGLFVYGTGLRLPLNLLCCALTIGGLFAMNGWDLPTYLGLAVVCIIVQQWLVYQTRFSWSFLLDVFAAVASLAALSFLLYLPFYLNFISPSQGVGLLAAQQRSCAPEQALNQPTAAQYGCLQYEVYIYTVFALVFVTLLIVAALKKPLAEIPLVTAIAEEVKQYRWLALVTLVTLIAVGTMTAVFVPANATFIVAFAIVIVGVIVFFKHLSDRALAFTLFLGILAFTLVVGAELFVLRDVFADGVHVRMNTVFKFYFQAWILLSIACGAGLFFIVERFTVERAYPQWRALLGFAGKAAWSSILLVLIIASLAYPLAAPAARVARADMLTGKPTWKTSYSLDGLAYLKDDPEHAGDLEAIRWLNQNVKGAPVIIEAYFYRDNNGQIEQGGDYSKYSRVSALTGLPTPMGWLGHEYQWRIQWMNRSPQNFDELYRRGRDMRDIYINQDPKQVMELMKRYKVQYLYVGQLERQVYTDVDLGRFQTFMDVAYQQNGVTIYKVR